MAETFISPSTSPLHSSNSVSSFPIIAVAVIGICATAFLLVGYYIFVIKCCLNWHRIEILRRFSLSRRREETLILRQSAELRGLDPSTIRSIPLINYKKPTDETTTGCECAVCLTEFQPEEQLKEIPICRHLFHIDCIDIWLQNNSNCPLCRITISAQNLLIPPHRILSSSDLAPNSGSPITAGDENFVVIELGRNLNCRRPLPLGSGEPPESGRKFRKKLTSMGDECIDMREKDEEFLVQPIRRSFSMDSSGDRQLYMAVQAAVRQNGGGGNGVEVEGCSSRVRRSFFSFGSGRGSRNAVLPIQFQVS